MRLGARARQTPAFAGHRPPAMRWLRRMPHGRWACRAAGCRCPFRAYRRAPASKHECIPPPPARLRRQPERARLTRMRRVPAWGASVCRHPTRRSAWLRAGLAARGWLRAAGVAKRLRCAPARRVAMLQNHSPDSSQSVKSPLSNTWIFCSTAASFCWQ